jgi:hypothetical protein
MMHKDFLDLRLDSDGLHTPIGLMALADISAADFTRNTEAVAGTTGAPTTSTAGVVGGAVVGGVIAGPVGAAAGGLAGSTIKTESPGEPGYAKTVSATIVFKANDLEYSTDVSVFDVEDAETFVGKVRVAAGLPPRT